MPNCVICGRPCSRLTCSPECKRTNENLVRSIRRKKARAAARMSRPPSLCVICQKEFHPTGPRRKTCGDEACMETYRKLYEMDRHGRVAMEFDCPICGKRVVTCRKSQETCGSDACYDKFYRSEHGDELRDKRADRGKKKPTDCPWANGWFDTMPPEVTTWDCGQMDPLTNRCEPGVWVDVRNISEVAA